jgi:hypothetical protein
VVEMPALPPVPGVLRIKLLWTVGEDTSVSTRLYFGYSGTAPSNTTCATIASSIFSSIATQHAIWVETYALTGVTVEDLSTTSGGFGEHIGSQAGTRAMAAFGNVAVLINAAIPRRYRGGKPRVYVPWLGTADITDAQTWDSTELAAAQTAWNAVIADILADGSGGTTITESVNVSFYSGFTSVLNPITGRTKDVPKVRTGTIPVDVISSWACNPKLGTQRRRVRA